MALSRGSCVLTTCTLCKRASSASRSSRSKTLCTMRTALSTVGPLGPTFPRTLRIAQMDSSKATNIRWLNAPKRHNGEVADTLRNRKRMNCSVLNGDRMAENEGTTNVPNPFTLDHSVPSSLGAPEHNRGSMIAPAAAQCVKKAESTLVKSLLIK